MTWLTAALAQATDDDADAGGGDDGSAVTLLLGVAAVSAIGWLAYRHRSTSSR